MITLKPGRLSGRIRIPPSKSVAHRGIIAAALSYGRSILSNVNLSDDISATIDCVKELGADCKYLDNSMLQIDGINVRKNKEKASVPRLECRESGSSLRFIMPVALTLGENVYMTGSKRLFERPLTAYEGFFDIQKVESGIACKGGLRPGVFELPGDISSQFVTGLMLALPILNLDSRIIMTSALQSRPYVDLSIQVLEKFGIRIINNNYEEFIITGNQSYTPCDFKIEGDYSQAAFWLVANALGSDIICLGLDPKSQQGDKEIVDIIQRDDKVIDVGECPDIVPVLAVLCCLRQGERKIVNAKRLRLKESDRLHAITLELNKLGADIKELDDGLIIRGVNELNGGMVNAHNDHRIAMALAIAATRCNHDVTIEGHQCVSKSYPAFFDDYTHMWTNVPARS